MFTSESGLSGKWLYTVNVLLLLKNAAAHFSKNFTFLYSEDQKRWELSPAYDLTYSSSLGGEHATTVHGNGMNPSLPDIICVAEGIGINKTKARNIALDIEDCVRENLAEYLKRQ